MDYLLHVLERTKEYAALKTNEEITPYYADDYIFRGSIIGPITNQHVIDTQSCFNVAEAYPELNRGGFGFQIDHNNPYRCFFFERWTGTHTGVIKLGPLITIPATNRRIETPLHITSITWIPEIKYPYLQLRQRC